jgi:hypothetical protein
MPFSICQKSKISGHSETPSVSFVVSDLMCSKLVSDTIKRKLLYIKVFITGLKC